MSVGGRGEMLPESTGAVPGVKSAEVEGLREAPPQKREAGSAPTQR